MTPPPGPGQCRSLRAALEGAYGLALAALSDVQLQRAAEAAGVDPAGPLGEAALARVVDCLPIEESWLFRNEELWQWLHGELLSPMLAEAWARGSPLRLASVGCSCGQEAFSLAVVLQRLLEEWGVIASAAHEQVEIVGYDCSAARIAAARSGELNAWSVERSGLDWARPRLSDLGGGRWRVDDSVRSMCRFEVANLLDLVQGPRLSGFQVVLCRHALIYFEPSRAAQVVALLAAWLDPGTVLVLGAPEAHLLEGVPGLEPLPHLAAARVRSHLSAASAAVARARSALRAPRAGAPGALPARRRPPRRAAAPASSSSSSYSSSSPSPAGAVAAPAARASRDAHLQAALDHAAAGRDAQALEEARLARTANPHDLTTRLVHARALAAVDGERGKAALRELLEETARSLSPGSLATTPELSVDQIVAAARLLLKEDET